ncbi:hypothetical protein BD626DRAFT_567446 [Schizophyllum amplum]|uniref:Uncharacterized protein n=1 Tax=Schizophyllum amplum TaxID=97359 RepID=A0A550CL59_9AGAR|nr:hypothetical protein BD626DRAFT_567446 [Auriculariopsis ampla]
MFSIPTPSPPACQLSTRPSRLSLHERSLFPESGSTRTVSSRASKPPSSTLPTQSYYRSPTLAYTINPHPTPPPTHTTKTMTNSSTSFATRKPAPTIVTQNLPANGSAAMHRDRPHLRQVLDYIASRARGICATSSSTRLVARPSLLPCFLAATMYFITFTCTPPAHGHLFACHWTVSGSMLYLYEEPNVPNILGTEPRLGG